MAVREAKAFRLINTTGGTYDWQLLDEEGKNVFEKILVTRLTLDASAKPSLILEVPIYPTGINTDALIHAENIGIKVVDYRKAEDGE